MSVYSSRCAAIQGVKYFFSFPFFLRFYFFLFFFLFFKEGGRETRGEKKRIRKRETSEQRSTFWTSETAKFRHGQQPIAHGSQRDQNKQLGSQIRVNRVRILRVIKHQRIEIRIRRQRH